MFWYFAFAAVIAWLLYLALRQRIDFAMEQLKQDIAVEVGALRQSPKLAAKEDLEEEPVPVEEDLKQGLEAVAENAQPKGDLDARMRKQVYKDFPRFGIHDAYTVSELLRSYDREDKPGTDSPPASCLRARSLPAV